MNDKYSLKSMITLQNVRELCETHLAGHFDIEVIDLAENFALGRQDQIIALPTLVRLSPPPVRKVIGEILDTNQAAMALGLPGGSETWP